MDLSEELIGSGLTLSALYDSLESIKDSLECTTLDSAVTA